MFSGVLCAVVLAVPGDSLQRYEFAQIHMGVPFTIRFYASEEAVATEASRAAFRRIRQLNAMLSDYDPESELSRLSRTAGSGKAVKVSPELLLLLSRSQELWRRSDGAFDVTVGPMVRLWRKARRERKLPDAAALAEARRAVSSEFMEIDAEAGTVKLTQPGMRLDLGAIAKGYAADEALRVLKEHGVSRALVDASGDIVMGDPPPGKQGWRIAVAPLEKERNERGTSLVISNAAVATSGDAYQYVEIDGVRYSHIVDPKTGLGLTTPSSVTVIAPDGLTADALASAVSVLGPRRGLDLVEATKGAAALVVRVEDSEPVTFTSERFAEFAAPTEQ